MSTFKGSCACEAVVRFLNILKNRFLFCSLGFYSKKNFKFYQRFL